MTTQTNGRPVLVGVDGSTTDAPTVRWAARHAAETGAALRILHAAANAETMTYVLPVPAGISTSGLRRPGPDPQRVLASAAAEADAHLPPVRVTTEPVTTETVTALLDASVGASLLVLGSGDHGRLSTLFGSVAARVVTAASCPTVVVRGESPPGAPVMVAVDDSESCEPALRFAFREAARRSSPLFAVHSWQPPHPRTGGGALTVAAMADSPGRQSMAEDARAALGAVLAPLRATFPDVVVHERLLDGHPEVTVPTETAGAALVVTGSRGRGPLTGLLLGSTSQALVHRSNCPVAVVREPGDRS